MNHRSPILALLIVASSAIQTRAADFPTAKTHANSVGIKLVRIEPGTFSMGNGEKPPITKADWEGRDWDESPAHKVKISRPFYLGSTEVTNAQYEKFDPEHKKLRGKFGASEKDDEPVTHVTWQQAVDYCQWLSKQEGLPYRLPTEAEWEYACRAGTTTKWHTGESIGPEQANIAKGSTDNIAHKKVGSYPANAWGLFDMHGNVAEWCHDWFGPYEAGEQTNPVGAASGDARVTRGWSILRSDRSGLRYARSANRSGHLPIDANAFTGFRVVLGELAKTAPTPVKVPLHQQNVKQTAASVQKLDPAKPYFVNFASPKNPKLKRIPQDNWGPIFGAHNHFSAICVCPNGDVLTVWYTTVGEGGRELVQAASRLRAGAEEWDEPTLFFGVPDCNSHAPVLLSDGKRLYHFFTQSFAGWDSAADFVRTSDDSGASWSQARFVVPRTDPRKMTQPCSAFVDKSGKIVVALDGDSKQQERVATSSDRGETWQLRAGNMRDALDKHCQHPAVVELSDGTYMSFMRGPDPMGIVVSKDSGDSWQAAHSLLPGIGVGAKTAAMRLASGAIFIASADTRKEYFGGGVYVALSLDDGKTWAHSRKLDPNDNPPGGYLSVAQAPDGLIYLAGSGPRCMVINEAWLKVGGPLPARAVETPKK